MEGIIESVRQMPSNTYEENEKEKEVHREQLREVDQKQQQNIEKESLFFDMSFWRSGKISTCGYCFLDVSMCIATHGAKPLTSLELDMLSETSLIGPLLVVLLVATIVHVNNTLGLYNL